VTRHARRAGATLVAADQTPAVRVFSCGSGLTLHRPDLASAGEGPATPCYRLPMRPYQELFKTLWSWRRPLSVRRAGRRHRWLVALLADLVVASATAVTTLFLRAVWSTPGPVFLPDTDCTAHRSDAGAPSGADLHGGRDQPAGV